MKYKAIIFDWDGTLMDSVNKIVETMQSSAAHLGLPVPDYQQAKDVIGISLLPALKQLFQIEDEQQAMTLLHIYREHFKQHQEICSPLFAGAIDLLTNLQQKGYVLAVATGKGRQGLEHNWQQSNTAGYFVTSRTADDAKSKPSPDMLQQILSELGLSAAEVLMVGDTTYDMAMAQAINMDCIGISHGVHSPEELNKHQPIAVIDSLDQLMLHL